MTRCSPLIPWNEVLSVLSIIRPKLVEIEEHLVLFNNSLGEYKTSDLEDFRSDIAVDKRHSNNWNYVELVDLIDFRGASDEESEELVEGIRFVWECVLRARYPKWEIDVFVTNDEDMHGPTLNVRSRHLDTDRI